MASPGFDRGVSESRMALTSRAAPPQRHGSLTNSPPATAAGAAEAVHFGIRDL